MQATFSCTSMKILMVFILILAPSHSYFSTYYNKRCKNNLDCDSKETGLICKSTECKCPFGDTVNVKSRQASWSEATKTCLINVGSFCDVRDPIYGHLKLFKYNCEAHLRCIPTSNEIHGVCSSSISLVLSETTHLKILLFGLGIFVMYFFLK